MTIIAIRDYLGWIDITESDYRRGSVAKVYHATPLNQGDKCVLIGEDNRITYGTWGQNAIVPNLSNGAMDLSDGPVFSKEELRNWPTK